MFTTVVACAANGIPLRAQFTHVMDRMHINNCGNEHSIDVSADGATLGSSAQTAPSRMDLLETQSFTAIKESNREKAAQMLSDVQRQLLELIDSDGLQSASDFLKASKLIDTQQEPFDLGRVKYELTLTALVMGSQRAQVDLGATWDDLLVSMSRGRRIGVQEIPLEFGTSRYQLHESAKSILNAYKNPESATKLAKEATSNPEVKAIVDADQKDRASDWSKFTMAEIEELGKRDEARLKRIFEIVEEGGIKTADDFDNAALVCQHGQTFEDYALAHELSVCALLLGKKSASWLAGASYDRMLANCGYRQRFATQYKIYGGVTSLSKVDVEHINDTERKTLVHKTLADARNKKWN